MSDHTIERVADTKPPMQSETCPPDEPVAVMMETVPVALTEDDVRQQSISRNRMKLC